MRTPRRPAKNGEHVLRAVRPNAGIAAGYRKKLCCIIDEMAKSYAYWLRANYRANPPVMAQDASPAVELERAVRRLGRRWQKNINSAAPELARYFAQSTAKRSDAALRAILKKAGISVKFKMTASMNDVMQATVAENVGLIRSIPQQFHTEVQGLVMRSVSTGRDLQQLTNDLQERFVITRKRAKFIALDQSNKATSALMKARQTDLGIEEGVWLHSHAGKTPRVTHLANDGKRFNIVTGWFDPDPRVRERIMPGFLPRCRCTWKPVIKGFNS